jgi:uncharacterized membrane protein YhdT
MNNVIWVGGWWFNHKQLLPFIIFDLLFLFVVVYLIIKCFIYKDISKLEDDEVRK